MTRRPRLECRKAVLEVTPEGDILEIAFSGVHGEGFGSELANYLSMTVETDRPAAIVLNFLKFDHVFGDDIGGIVPAFIRRGETPNVRPCSIVAKGRTARSLRSLLNLTLLTKTLDITFFEDVGEAVHHLRSRLE